jgi:hypothetical protein
MQAKQPSGQIRPIAGRLVSELFTQHLQCTGKVWIQTIDTNTTGPSTAPRLLHKHRRGYSDIATKINASKHRRGSRLRHLDFAGKVAWYYPRSKNYSPLPDTALSPQHTLKGSVGSETQVRVPAQKAAPCTSGSLPSI